VFARKNRLINYNPTNNEVKKNPLKQRVLFLLLFRNAKSRAAMIIMKSDASGKQIDAVVKDIILCKRGILPSGKGKSYTRYTLDLAVVPVLPKETYLPVIVDPSHAAGRRDFIYTLSCAGITAVSCLIVEVQYNPTEALTDEQQIPPGRPVSVRASQSDWQ